MHSVSFLQAVGLQRFWCLESRGGVCVAEGFDESGERWKIVTWHTRFLAGGQFCSWNVWFARGDPDPEIAEELVCCLGGVACALNCW